MRTCSARVRSSPRAVSPARGLLLGLVGLVAVGLASCYADYYGEPYWNGYAVGPYVGVGVGYPFYGGYYGYRGVYPYRAYYGRYPYYRGYYGRYDGRSYGPRFYGAYRRGYYGRHDVRPYGRGAYYGRSITGPHGRTAYRGAYVGPRGAYYGRGVSGPRGGAFHGRGGRR